MPGRSISGIAIGASRSSLSPWAVDAGASGMATYSLDNVTVTANFDSAGEVKFLRTETPFALTLYGTQLSRGFQALQARLKRNGWTIRRPCPGSDKIVAASRATLPDPPYEYTENLTQITWARSQVGGGAAGSRRRVGASPDLAVTSAIAPLMPCLGRVDGETCSGVT